jgi:crossover junction endodeoxyribonuclease RusA
MITLHLPFPPSVNTYYRRSKHSTYLSQKGRDYKQKVAEVVSTHYPLLENAMAGRLSVFLSLFPPTHRSMDIDNRVKATLDALQDAGVFEDDEQIDELHVVRREVVKGGRCMVVVATR